MRALSSAALVALLGAFMLGFAGPAVVGAATPPACVATPANCSTISVTLSGNGSGYLRTDDGLVNCRREGGITSGSCEHTYDLTGLDYLDYGIVFAGDVGSCYMSGPTCYEGGTGFTGQLAPGIDLPGGAEFRLVAPEAVTVAKAGSGVGAVTSTPRGIACPQDCSSDFSNGAILTLQAVAGTGSKFSSWGSGPCSGQGATCTFSVGAGPITIAVVFDKKATATPRPTPRVTPTPTEPPTPVPPTEVPPTEPPTAAPTVAATAAAPTPPEPATEAPTAPPTAPASTGDAPIPTLVLLAGALVLVVIAFAGGWAMRRRGTSA